MAAIAGVFHEAVPLSNSMHTMAQQIAQVANLLAECFFSRVCARPRGEQQRMAALNAHVLTVFVAFTHFDVAVPAEKTWDVVPDARL